MEEEEFRSELIQHKAIQGKIGNGYLYKEQEHHHIDHFSYHILAFLGKYYLWLMMVVGWFIGWLVGSSYFDFFETSRRRRHMMVMVLIDFGRILVAILEKEEKY